MSKLPSSASQPARANPSTPQAKTVTEAPIPTLRPAPRWVGIALAVTEGGSVAGLFIFLLARSWLRWSDPLIDFPRTLYAAWRLNEGDLLYKDVVSWYGPLAHLMEAAAFKVFGVGLNTIVMLNLAVTVGVLLLLRAIFGTLGNRLAGWLGMVVFLCVFAFGNYGPISNYNFITPYASQATYGFAGLLLMLWALLHHIKSGRPIWLAIAGLGMAITYLDKPEELLAAAGTLGVYLLVRVIQSARIEAPHTQWAVARRWLARALAWLAGGFFCAWLPVFLFFAAKGGLAYASYAANYVPGTMLSSSFRSTIEGSPLMKVIFGFDQPWLNFRFELWQGGWFVLTCGLMAIAAHAWTRTKRHSAGWWAWPIIVLLAAGAAAWLARLSDDLGPEFALPVCFAAGAYAIRSLRTAWHGSADFSRSLALTVFGIAAALMLGRMILSARILHFGFFQMPLAVLFWVHLILAEASRPTPGAMRRNWLLPVAFSALMLLGSGTLLRTSLSYYALKNYPVGTGRDRFYSFQPGDYTAGEYLNTMIAAFRQNTPNARTLAAFPEGIAVNYHLRIRNPLAEMDFQPVALGFAGPDHVLDELKAHPPDAIFLFNLDLSEYGAKYFGVDDASGRDIALWLGSHYTPVVQVGPTKNSVTGYCIDLAVPAVTESTRPPLAK